MRIFPVSFPMNYPFFVGGGEGGGELAGDPQRVFAVELAALAEPALERLTLEVFHHHVGRAVGQLAEVMYFDEPWMMDQAGRPRLVQKPLHRSLVGGQLRMQDFDGDALIDRLVLSLKDGAHTALTKQLDDPVFANALANQRARIGFGLCLDAHGR